MGIEDKDQKEKERQRLFSSGGEASAKVEIFEDILAKSTSGYVVQDAGLTIADLTYFGFLNSIRSGFVEGLDRSIFKDYTRIMKHKDMVARIPAVKSYYENEEKSNPMKVPYYDVFLPDK